MSHDGCSSRHGPRRQHASHGHVVVAARRPLSDAALGPAALTSWHDVQLALTRSLPVLWDSVSDHRSAPQLSLIRRLDCPRVRTAGLSRGWSVIRPCVRIAPHLAGVRYPVPETYLATASVNPSGAVALVEGLPEKIMRFSTRASSKDDRRCGRTGVRRAIICGDRLECRWRAKRRRSVRNRLRRQTCRQASSARCRCRRTPTTCRIVVPCCVKGTRPAHRLDPLSGQQPSLLISGWSSRPTNDGRSSRRGVAARHQRNAGRIPVREQIRSTGLAPSGSTCFPSSSSSLPIVVIPHRTLSWYWSDREILRESMDGSVHRVTRRWSAARVEAVTGAPHVLSNEKPLNAIIGKCTSGMTLEATARMGLRFWRGACGSRRLVEHAESRRRAEPVRCNRREWPGDVRLSWHGRRRARRRT